MGPFTAASYCDLASQLDDLVSAGVRTIDVDLGEACGLTWTTLNILRAALVHLGPGGRLSVRTENPALARQLALVGVAPHRTMPA